MTRGGNLYFMHNIITSKRSKIIQKLKKLSKIIHVDRSIDYVDYLNGNNLINNTLYCVPST